MRELLGRDARVGGRGREGGRIRLAQGMHGVVHHDPAADNQGGALKQVGPRAGLQSAREDVDGGRDADNPAGDREVAQVETEQRLALEVHADDLRAGVDDGGRGHADENDHGADGHDGAGEDVVAVFEKLGDRVDAALEEGGQEYERDENQRDGGHPLVTGDGHAQPVGRLAAHADELLRGDVGGDEREADQPPGQAPAGEKVVLPRFLFAALGNADRDHAGHKSDEDEDVEGADRHKMSFLCMAPRTRRDTQTPAL
jgi:hypothetical protein